MHVRGPIPIPVSQNNKIITSASASLAKRTSSSDEAHHPHSITYKSGHEHHNVLPHEVPHAMCTLRVPTCETESACHPLARAKLHTQHKVHLIFKASSTCQRFFPRIRARRFSSILQDGQKQEACTSGSCT